MKVCTKHFLRSINLTQDVNYATNREENILLIRVFGNVSYKRFKECKHSIRVRISKEMVRDPVELINFINAHITNIRPIIDLPNIDF